MINIYASFEKDDIKRIGKHINWYTNIATHTERFFYSVFHMCLWKLRVIRNLTRYASEKRIINILTKSDFERICITW